VALFTVNAPEIVGTIVTTTVSVFVQPPGAVAVTT
jgi:hypothetical protein